MPANSGERRRKENPIMVQGGARGRGLPHKGHAAADQGKQWTSKRRQQVAAPNDCRHTPWPSSSAERCVWTMARSSCGHACFRTCTGRRQQLGQQRRRAQDRGKMAWRCMHSRCTRFASCTLWASKDRAEQAKDDVAREAASGQQSDSLARLRTGESDLSRHARIHSRVRSERGGRGSSASKRRQSSAVL